MNVLKQLARRILLNEYEELHRSPEQSIWFDNFRNLVQSYEQVLNESAPSNQLILPNETRPKLLTRLLGTPPSEAYFIIQALAKCRELEGDVCEFGVAQGETSALIANEIKLTGHKVLHLFDSFEGLPQPSEKDRLKDDVFALGSMEAYAGRMSCMEDMVLARLKAVAFPEQRYQIHKGFFEEIVRSDRHLPEKVCFAYVDFDLYEPIKLALEFLHRVTPGGASIVVDDYDFFSTGARTAVDEFIAENNAGDVFYDCFVPNTQYGHFAVLTKKG